jgi:hypothetical protein
MIISMKLFAIRLENAETVIVSAENTEQALKAAGITPKALQDFQQQGIPRDHADIVLDGFGPQHYEIRELEHIGIRLRIAEWGTFHLADMDQPTFDALYQGYPMLEAVASEIAARWPDTVEIEAHRAEHDALFEDAMLREKTRLMLPLGED